MNAIDELQRIHVEVRFGWAAWRALSLWALERLVSQEDNGDADIILLAGCSFEDESLELSGRILEKYLTPEKQVDEYWAGKYIAGLYDAFCRGEVVISELDNIFNKIDRELGYPEWLVMLSRNCEYAIDLEGFEVPFYEEFAYIASLWCSCESLAAFLSKYDRSVSNSHDLQ